MRKTFIAFTALMLLLTGCKNADDAVYQDQLLTYESYYRSLLNEDKFETSSRYYSITAELTKSTSDTGYEYYVVVDKPNIAMYDVEVMVVENEKPFDSAVEMQPSAGIFEGDYNFIPNQAREDKGFKAGIVLGRLGLEEPNVNIRVLVTWKNYTKLETFKEVFEFPLSLVSPTQ